MPTIQEIKEHYGNEQARIINESFALGASAQHFEGSMSPEVEERLGPQESERVRIAESHLWADGERDRLRTRYEELDLEKRAALEVRVEEVERELSPREADFRDFAAAASATPETLITALDMALAAGNEDAALVAFSSGQTAGHRGGRRPRHYRAGRLGRPLWGAGRSRQRPRA